MQTFGLLKFLCLANPQAGTEPNWDTHTSMCRKASLLTLVVVGKVQHYYREASKGVQDTASACACSLLGLEKKKAFLKGQVRRGAKSQGL